jgi:hypothetical protein
VAIHTYYANRALTSYSLWYVHVCTVQLYYVHILYRALTLHVGVCTICYVHVHVHYKDIVYSMHCNVTLSTVHCPAALTPSLAHSSSYVLPSYCL